jgi:cation transport ATPase
MNNDPGNVDSGLNLLNMLEDNLEEFDSDHFHEFFTYAGENYQDEFGGETEDTVERGRTRERKRKRSFISAFFYLIGQRFKSGRIRREQARRSEEEEIREPRNIPKLAARYARPIGSMAARSRIAFVICALMVYLTVSFEFTGSAAVIGSSRSLMLSVLMLMQLVTMLLCLEIPVIGFFTAIRGKAGAETLITASFIVTFADSAVALLTGNMTQGLPFVAISALSAMFGLRGMLSYNTAMRDSLRVLSKIKSPWGLVADTDSVEDRTVLKRLPDSTKGFYRNLMGRDICEHVYSYAAPLMLVAAVVLAFLSTVVRSRIGDFLHVLAALVAVTASFSALSAYSMPFKTVASLARRGGCAVAGWTGADKLFDIDGVYITDNDLFPRGAQTVVGVRVVGNMSRYKAAEYAGSLTAESGSSLSMPFDELMREEGAAPVDVLNFNSYDGGGIGGMIRGESAMLGTAGFMTMMGIRLPEDAPSGRVIYLSVNSRVAAMFAVKYKASDAVRRSLAALKRTRLTMLFALKDFNLAPKLLEKRFGVNLAGAEYIPLEDCYRIAREEVAKNDDTVGVVNKGGFIPMARTAAYAAKLRQAALISTAVSVLGSIAELVILFYMCWNGPVYSVTVWAVGLFMLAMYLITVILANLTRR